MPANSIHWHFRTRQDLLDALARKTVSDLYDALPSIERDRPWDEQLVSESNELRRQLLVRPRFLDLPSDRALLLTSPELRHKITLRLGTMISMLEEAGIPTEDAYRIYHICVMYVRGLVRVELADAVQSDTVGWEASSEDVAAPLEVDILALRWTSSERQFQLGLEVLVAGIRTTMVQELDHTR